MFFDEVDTSKQSLSLTVARVSFLRHFIFSWDFLPFDRLSKRDVIFGQHGAGGPHSVLQLILKFIPVDVNHLIHDNTFDMGLSSWLFIVVVFIIFWKHALSVFLRLHDIAIEWDSVSSAKFSEFKSDSFLNAPKRVQNVEKLCLVFSRLQTYHQVFSK